MNEVALNYGLQPEQIQSIENQFLPVKSKIQGIQAVYNSIVSAEMSPELCYQARELRLKIRPLRTKELKELHETNKAYFLNGGRFVDSIYNRDLKLVEQMETQLKEIEEYYENIEAQRIKDLQNERITELRPFLQQGEPERIDLGNMDIEVWTAFLKSKKDFFAFQQTEKAKAEAERLETIEREKQERERIRFENEKLRQEAEIKAKELEEIKRKQKEIIEKQQAEAERIRKIEAEKQAKIQSELKAKAEAERKERERIELELKAKQEAELKAKQEAERIAAEKLKAEIMARKAPVKQQLTNWIESLNMEPAPVNNETSKLIKEKFTSFKNWAKAQIQIM